MKFIKEITPKGLLLPVTAARLAGFEANEKAEYHTLKGAMVVLKGQMTAMELLRAIDSIQDAALELTLHVVNACGPCEDCSGSGGEECPADPSRTMTVIPDEVRKEVHIPEDVKLCAWPGDKPGTVTVGQADYRYDLTDVPAWELEILASHGVCLGSLEEMLMAEDVVYGA